MLIGHVVHEVLKYEGAEENLMVKVPVQETVQQKDQVQPRVAEGEQWGMDLVGERHHSGECVVDFPAHVAHDLVHDLQYAVELVYWEVSLEEDCS